MQKNLKGFFRQILPKNEISHLARVDKKKNQSQNNNKNKKTQPTKPQKTHN